MSGKVELQITVSDELHKTLSTMQKQGCRIMVYIGKNRTVTFKNYLNNTELVGIEDDYFDGYVNPLHSFENPPALEEVEGWETNEDLAF